MDIQKIKELALANGFKLKEQASGNMDLNAYVYDFANAIEQAAKAQAVPEGFVLIRFGESCGINAKLRICIFTTQDMRRAPDLLENSKFWTWLE